MDLLVEELLDVLSSGALVLWTLEHLALMDEAGQASHYLLNGLRVEPAAQLLCFVILKTCIVCIHCIYYVCTCVCK